MSAGPIEAGVAAGDPLTGSGPAPSGPVALAGRVGDARPGRPAPIPDAPLTRSGTSRDAQLTRGPKKFVAVAGNMGVGKSTLTQMLADRLGWAPFFEAVDENPYLADFYRDMARWGFHSQMFFLSRRLEHHHRILQHPTAVIQDRCVYEDAEVFAGNLHRQGLMSQREWDSYRRLYEILCLYLPPPDLVVYLRAGVDTVLRRIALRGRDFERGVSRDYLSQLEELYEAWIGGFALCPVLAVPADRLDFVQQPEDFELIVDRILQALRGEQLPLF